MKTTLFLTSLIIAFYASGSIASVAEMPKSATLPAKDAYGCVGEEGYSWCVKLKQCVRPSKILIENDLELTPENFHTFCQTKQQ